MCTAAHSHNTCAHTALPTCQAGFCSCRVLSEARCLRLEEERLDFDPRKEREPAKDLRMLGGLDWPELCWLLLKVKQPRNAHFTTVHSQWQGFTVVQPKRVYFQIYLLTRHDDQNALPVQRAA